MPTCPSGHQSSAGDFCDTCGIKIGGQQASGAAAQPVAPAPSVAPAGPAGLAGAAGPAGPAQACPECGGARTGKFCEVCGYDFAAGRPSRPAGAGAATGTSEAPVAGVLPPQVEQAAESAPGTAAEPGAAWTVVVTADRGYYDRVIKAGGPDAASIEFPSYCPERLFRLSGRENRIGRRSTSRGLEPEIDLSGPPADPGVSHLHAVLIAQPDGGWAVLDPGSSNGTQVNGQDIDTGVPVRLHDGDRISVGAWTVLAVHAG